ncbi:MAG: hypothetical protein AAGI37_10130 [Planctomycetota bacterium]
MKKSNLKLILIAAFAGFLLGLLIGLGRLVSLYENLRVEYANNTNDFVELSFSYTRHFDQHGDWPTPGTYSTPDMQYIKTLSESPRGVRTDVYVAGFDDMAVDFELRPDGEIRVRPFPL